MTSETHRIDDLLNRASQQVIRAEMQLRQQELLNQMEEIDCTCWLCTTLNN